LKTFKSFLFIVFCSSIFGQNISEFPKGLGLEIGMGHSEMTWSDQTAWGEFSLDDFSLSPEIRGFYHFQVMDNIYIHSFIGYQQIKGFGIEPIWIYNLNQKYTLDRIFVGGNFLYHFSKLNFYTGLGMKVLKITHATLESHSNDPSYPWSLEKQDLKNTFNEYGLDIGIIANLEVLNFLFSLEGWFGITNLHKIPDYGSAEIAPLQLTIKENHFRFLLGYKF